MRCLFAHRWIRGKAFDFTSREPAISFVIPYRTCERCGTMQRGHYDAASGKLFWETMREQAYVISEQTRIVRQRSSPLDRLAHSLGLRRSRAGDDVRLGKRSALTRS